MDTLWFLRLNSSSKIVSQNTLITPELRIMSITDYSEIDIKLKCDNCYIVNSETSGGIINLNGETNSFTVWARASLQINAEKFMANYVTVKTESIGDCYVHVNKELSVEVFRSGYVYYIGDPYKIEYINEKAKEQLIKID